MILAASLLIAFLLFLALYLVVGRAASQHRAVSSRVQEYAGIDLDAGRIKEPSALQEIGMALRRWLQKRARKNARKKQGTSLDMRMQQAGIPPPGIRIPAAPAGLVCNRSDCWMDTYRQRMEWGGHRCRCMHGCMVLCASPR